MAVLMTPDDRHPGLISGRYPPLLRDLLPPLGSKREGLALGKARGFNLKGDSPLSIRYLTVKKYIRQVQPLWDSSTACVTSWPADPSTGSGETWRQL